KPQVWHATDAIKHARRPAQSVNVFGEEYREWTKLGRQSLQSRLCGTIKTKLFDTFTKPTSRKIREVFAQTAPNRPPHQHPRKAVITKKRAVSEHARQKESDVSFQHDENENCVKPVLKQ